MSCHGGPAGIDWHERGYTATITQVAQNGLIKIRPRGEGTWRLSGRGEGVMVSTRKKHRVYALGIKI